MQSRTFFPIQSNQFFFFYNSRKDTPIDNTKRALFKEPEINGRSAPLGTKTNIQTNVMNNNSEVPQKEALSPSLQNVSQLKSWITKMEKENKEKSKSAWKKPPSLQSKVARTKQTSGRVHQMREKIVERKHIPKGASHVVKTPAPSTRNVKIPMNKVQQMRQILLDYQNNQAKQSEQIHMSSKKRAKIAERLNRVQDIQKWLNKMEVQNRKAAARNDASVPKTKEFNLPMNRVSEMKNWLIEFEKQNKEHCNRFSTKSTNLSAYQYGGYVPTNHTLPIDSAGLKNNQGQVDTNARMTIETPSKTAVSELAQFLVDFEKKNKEHYERSQRKGNKHGSHNLQQDGSDEEDEETDNVNVSIFDEFLIDNNEGSIEDDTVEEEAVEEDTVEEDTIEDDTVEDDTVEDDTVEDETAVVAIAVDECAKDEHSEGSLEIKHQVANSHDDHVVLNTSILDSQNDKREMNISMMPIMNDLEQSQWDEDYDDLMKVDINIEPVKSTESWEDESFGYSNESEEEDTLNENPKEDETEGVEVHGMKHDAREEEDVSISGQYENKIQQCTNESPTSIDSSIQSSPDSVKDTDLKETFDNHDGDELLGEDFLSTSYAGARFSTSFSNPNEKNSCAQNEDSIRLIERIETIDNSNEIIRSSQRKADDEIKCRVNTKGFGCVYKSLFRVFAPKKRSTENRLSAEEEGVELVVKETEPKKEENYGDSLIIKCNQDGTLDVSIDNHQTEGYLPNTYTSGSTDEPQDFAREILLGRVPHQFDPNCESPMSLASAFRRSMSPTSSSCAGSELSGVHAMISGGHNTTNVAQHVGWLQGHFHSPKAARIERKNNKLY